MDELFSWLFEAACDLLVAYAVYKFIEYVDESIARQQIQEKLGSDCIGAQIKSIVKDGNAKRITFASLKDGQEFAIKTNKVGNDLWEGKKIYV